MQIQQQTQHPMPSNNVELLVVCRVLQLQCGVDKTIAFFLKPKFAPSLLTTTKIMRSWLYQMEQLAPHQAGK